MYKNLKFLLESYGSKEPTYFGPLDKKEAFMKWLKKMKHEVHEDGSVSVDGDVNFKSLFSYESLEQYIGDRLPFNFQKVTGDFFCPKQITSLTGSPRYVSSFVCGSENQNVSSMEGSPEYVEKDFWCMSNKIKSLEGAPEVIKGYFGTKWFSKDDHRKFVKEREINRKLNKKLSKDFSEDALKALDDFS